MLRSRRLPDFNRSLNDAETIGSGVLDGGVGAVSEAEGADPDWLEPDASAKLRFQNPDLQKMWTDSVWMGVAWISGVWIAGAWMGYAWMVEQISGN
ncbi:hypothetical protein Bca4012_029363 [Brassica carinata]